MTGSQGTSIDHIPVPAAGVEMEVVEGEVLLYHPQQTRAVYLNPTAAVVWGLCDGSRSVRGDYPGPWRKLSGRRQPDR